MKTLKFITALAVILALTAFATNVDIFAGEANDTALNSKEKENEFFLQDEKGNIVSLTEYSKAKGLILIFTTEKNRYSGAYEEKILNLNKKYTKMGYPVIVIHPMNPKKKHQLLSEHNQNIDQLYLLDETKNPFSNRMATKSPLVYSLHKKANGYKIKYMGALGKKTDREMADAHYIKKAVAALVESGKSK